MTSPSSKPYEDKIEILSNFDHEKLPPLFPKIVNLFPDKWQTRRWFNFIENDDGISPELCIAFRDRILKFSVSHVSATIEGVIWNGRWPFRKKQEHLRTLSAESYSSDSKFAVAIIESVSSVYPLADRAILKFRGARYGKQRTWSP